MKAFTKTVYGGPEILRLEEVDTPIPQKGEVLVRILANSVNPADWHILRGKPFLARLVFGFFTPKDKILGADYAGVVESVGEAVTLFAKGNRVFGSTLRGGAFAEYMAVPEAECALMPEEISFPEMACLPIAGITALQALVTHGKIQKGESVLINGSSGGVGHFAVQIAKVLGARVTAVCSGKNKDFVKQLGADEVIAYDADDIHTHKGHYDLIVDTNGNLFFSDFKRLGNRAVIVGFTNMAHTLGVVFKKAFSKYPLAQFTAQGIQADLTTLASMMQRGEIKPYIEKSYPFVQIPDAIRHIEAMRTRGKVVVVY